jgi:hypothetical protein
MDPDFLETLFPITLNFVDSRTEFSFWCAALNVVLLHVNVTRTVLGRCGVPLCWWRQTSATCQLRSEAL